MATPPPTGSAAARSALAQKLSGVPPDYLLIKLCQMLQEQREVLTWDPDGGIIIHDRQRLEATLSVYFGLAVPRGSEQLNCFGFHKKRKYAACLSGTAAQQRKGAALRPPSLGRTAAGRAPPPPRRAPAPAARRGLAPAKHGAPALGPRAPPVGEGAFNLLADVAAADSRRETQEASSRPTRRLLTRNASSSGPPRIARRVRLASESRIRGENVVGRTKLVRRLLREPQRAFKLKRRRRLRFW